MADDLKRVGLVFKEDGAVDFKKILQEVNLELNKNYNQFKLTQAQWDKSTKSTEKLRAEQEYLKNAYEIQTDKISTLKMQLSDLENAENKNTTAIKKKRNELTTAEIKLETYNKKIKEIESQLKNSGKTIEEFGNKIQNSGKKVEEAGKKVSAFSLATGTALLTCAKSAIDFQDDFTGVEKTVDGTAEQIAELKQGIRELAKEIPSTTKEISAVAESAGQLGIQTENVLEFTKTMIDMGNATNLSAEEAATTLARFANVTKMKQSDFNKLGSVIVALGNNFATTEAEIAQMGMNLASAGTQVGMTQSQIMALATALSSVGLEAQAGGTAFSKVMVNMQLAVEKGGESLKDFASVAGMSSKDFKKAFKEDATSAIMKFVEGLSKSDQRGKSAIKVLDDMEIKETRLRDALLRSANASDIFSKAIKLGNEAWEDNTALTNEANKRYDTLKSKVTIAVNKLKDMAITLGNKLMPSLEKVIDKFGKWIKKFESLSDEQVDIIVKIGLMVTAARPLLNILGKLTSTVGGVTKGIGIFTQALKVASGSATSTSNTVNNLSTVMKGLASPVGIVTGVLAAYATGVAIVDSKIKEELKTTKELISEINNSIDARQNVIDSINQQQNANLAEINNVQNLKKELSNLVEENGKVKEGCEARAQVILNELNKALETEYSLNNNVIKSYQDMQKNIDDLILKKKAQIILEANEEKYKEAIQNKTEAYEEYIKVQEEINELLPKYKRLLEDAQKGFIGSEDSLIGGTKKLKEYGEQIGTLQETLKKQDTQLQEYSKSINDYNTNTELMIKGGAENLKKIEQSVSITQSSITTNANEELSRRIANQIQANSEAKKLYDLEIKYNKDAKNSIYADNVKQGEKELALIAEQLVAKTSTIEELGLDEIAAWRILANNSYDEYSKAISKLPAKTQIEIQKTTGVLTTDISLVNASKDKANIMSKMFENKLTISNITQEEIEDSANKLNQDTSVETEAGEIAARAEQKVRANNSHKWGEDMVEGLGNGIKTKGNSDWFTNIIGGLAGKIASYLHFSRPDVGPLHEYEKWMPDMVEGLGKTLDKASPRLIKSVKSMANKMSDELNMDEITNIENSLDKQNAIKTYNSKNSKYSFQMNVYCQKLDNEELDNIFNYINRRFGTEY